MRRRRRRWGSTGAASASPAAVAEEAAESGKTGAGSRRPISSRADRADLVASRSWPCAGRGPVAQLVEQCVYTASVVGSSPAGSTVVLLIRTSALRGMGWLWSVEIARPILSGWAFSGVGLPVGSVAPVASYLVR